MATETRMYKTNERSTWRSNIQKVKWQPLYLIKIDTTGLDPINDRVVGIAIAKVQLQDDKFVLQDSYQTLVNPDRLIPNEVSAINCITNEMIEKAPDSETVFKKVAEFLGNEPIAVAGFNTKDFLGPFLMNELMRVDKKLSVNCVLNITQMAKSLVFQKKNVGYGYVELATRFKIKSDQGLKGYVDLFNKLYSLVPTGTEQTTVTKARYWKIAYDRRYIFFNTPCGDVRLNCYTGFWEEKTPGFFDMVDMDAFTTYVLNHKKCDSIWDLTKLAEG